MVNNQAGTVDKAAEMRPGRLAEEGKEAGRGASSARPEARRMDSMAMRRKWL